MSWFKRTPQESDAKQLRNKQVTQLKQLNPNIRALNSVESAFELICTTQYGNLVLHIILPDKFPQVACQVKVMNPVVHAWCNAQGVVVGHPDLMYWSPHHALGRIVREISEEFVRNPPKPRPNNNPQQPQPQPQPRPVANNFHAQQQQSFQNNRQQANTAQRWQQVRQQVKPQVQQPQMHQVMHPQQRPVHPQGRPQTQQPPAIPPKKRHHTPALPIPQDFPSLDSLSIAELEALDSDAAALSDYFDLIPEVAGLAGLRGDLYKSIQESAAANLAMKPEVERLQTENEALRQRVAKSQLAFNQVQVKRDTMLHKFSYKYIAQLLELEMKTLDNKSMDLVDVFRAQANESSSDSDSDEEDTGKKKKKKLTASKFASQYRKIREAYHLAACKKERLLQTHER